MMRRFGFLFLFTVISVACKSNGDGCEAGYVRQYGAEGTEWCIEAYVEDDLKEYNSGESYFHKDHGLITFADGIWTNKYNEIINP
ncbi:hypothetical protein GH721_12915 [Kriegella sp. EG-1]|nr:hypothetical protein [Flavobacteriaceae bacterium EG-1]